MGETTQFIMILAMSAGVGGWALAQLIMGLRRWETRRLQRRLVAELKGDLAGGSPVLIQRQSIISDMHVTHPRLL